MPSTPHQSPKTEYIEAVAKLVYQIPKGRVMTYGLIAEIIYDELGYGSPRVVGNVMANSFGSDSARARLAASGKPVVGPVQDNFDLPWWRVVNVQGDPPAQYRTAALAAFAREQTPMKRNGEQVDVKAAIWYPGSKT